MKKKIIVIETESFFKKDKFEQRFFFLKISVNTVIDIKRNQL